MSRTPETPIDWRMIRSYDDTSSAEFDAAYLRSEGVPARVVVHGNLPGQSGPTDLWVDASLEHRAIWLMKLPPVTEAELEFLATGEFPKPKDQG